MSRGSGADFSYVDRSLPPPAVAIGDARPRRLWLKFAAAGAVLGGVIAIAKARGEDDPERQQTAYMWGLPAGIGLGALGGAVIGLAVDLSRRP